MQILSANPCGAVFFLCITATLVPCSAQTSAAQGFDISSVKPANSDVSHGAIKRLDAGIMSVSAMTLNEIISLVYYVRPYQIIGGPEWMSRDRFDITGKDSTASSLEHSPGNAPAEQADDVNMQRMRELLMDRFGLKLHHEFRARPILSLVTDGRKRFRATPCSSTYRLQHGIVQGSIHTSSLAALLRAELGTSVRDDTGLHDCYVLDARWTTDPSNETLPSLPAAIRDLGFTLKRTKGDVDMIVIDGATRPKPD